MSDGVVLIFSEAIPAAADLAAALTGFDEVDVQPPFDSVHVGCGDNHLWIRPDYEDEDRGSIEAIREDWPPGTMPTYPRLVSVDFWNAPLAMDVVRRLAERWDFLIHTERGEDYTGAAFAARYDAEPGWNWGRHPHGRTGPSVVHWRWPPD